MGEMADFDLDEVATIEDMRDSYAIGEMSMHEAFDRGLIDHQGDGGAPMEEAYQRMADIGLSSPESLEMQLDSAERTLLASATSRGGIGASSRHPRIDLSKYAKKYAMLRGMMQHVLKGRELSDKQKGWLTTNLAFPVDNFPSVCRNDAHFRALIERLYEITHRGG